MDGVAFSLWFVPPSDVLQMFSDIITRYAKEYSSPLFLPHIALLSEIALPKDNVVTAMDKISKRYSPLSFRLTTIGYQESYHHALFIRVDLTQVLLEMNKYASEVLGMDPKPYMPHLSVLYGNHPNEVKEKLAEDLKHVALPTFVVDSLHLISSTGDESTWQDIYSAPLRGIAN